MASVTNLGEVRTARAAVEAYAQSYVKDLVKFISDESIAYADRAFIIASPARNSDPDLTRDVYRAAHRRLRASLRRRLGKRVGPEVKRQILEEAESVFRSRVWQLQDERDAAAKLANGNAA